MHQCDLIGQPEGEVEAATEANYCLTCGELRDVLIGLIRDTDPKEKSLIVHCPRRKGQTLAPWMKGEPWPRCAGGLAEWETIYL